MLLLLLAFPVVFASVADYGSVPRGLNPTLYSSDDYVVQLDESSFNDTVYCQGLDCSAFLVEFYSDWCGHCRAFAPLYKNLANDVKGWSKVVKIAAMNCADSVNEVTCRANGVQYFPYIKYFPRNATTKDDSSLLRPFWSIAEMREQLTKVVMDDYSVNRFDDWPIFDHLGDLLTYGDLWEGIPLEVQFMAIIFESHQASMTGAELLLDLHKYKDRLIARRCLKNHPLVEALHISDFPSMTIFRRGEKKPVLVAELRRLLLAEIENFLSVSSDRDLQVIHFSSRKNKNNTNNCETEPEKCRELFYVAEIDMLKAMKYALYRETARTGEPLQGSNLTALLSFVSLLADNFPVVSRGNNETYLERSNRAVRVFSRLRDFLQNKGENAVVPIVDWQKEFDAAETAAGHPFPVAADWDHCRGSTGQYRGYTCGLWTSFHTLTVSAYRQAVATNLTSFQPLVALQAIRDWVGSFFGCQHCRDHFIKMSTNTFKMEAQVQKPEDVFMYLWKAHNIVNARLKGRDTEDPKFPKFQFPARFLCNNCSTDSMPDEASVKEFLLDYYSNIKPFSNSSSDSLISKLL